MAEKKMRFRFPTSFLESELNWWWRCDRYGEMESNAWHVAACAFPHQMNKYSFDLMGLMRYAFHVFRHFPWFPPDALAFYLTLRRKRCGRNFRALCSFHAAIQNRISTLNACVRCSHMEQLICVMLLHIIITCKSTEHLLLALPFQLLRQRIQNAFKPFREFMSVRLRLLFGVVG